MALDPSLFSDIDALKSAGFDFNTGTTASERAASARPAGFGAGRAQTATDFVGKNLFKTSATAAQRAAAEAAQVAKAAGPVARGFGARAFSAVGGPLALGATVAAPAVIEGVRRSNELPATYETRLPRAGAIASSLLEYPGKVTDAVLDFFVGGSKVARDPELFGVPPAAAPAAPAAPTAAAPAPAATPASATAAAPAGSPAQGVERIENADGTTSYTNIAEVSQAANRAGSIISPIDATTSRGTVSTVPGVSEADRQRALSASLRDNQFAIARQIANTPEDLALIDIRERMVGARGRNLASLQRQEEALAASRGAVKKEAVKAAAEALKGGPAARKANAEADRINLAVNLLGRMMQSNNLNPDSALRLLFGQSPGSDKIEVIPSLTGSEPTVVKVKAGSSVAEILPSIKNERPGTIVQDPQGRRYVLQRDGSLKQER